jgi:hypothetical protein
VQLHLENKFLKVKHELYGNITRFSLISSSPTFVDRLLLELQYLH